MSNGDTSSNAALGALPEGQAPAMEIARSPDRRVRTKTSVSTVATTRIATIRRRMRKRSIGRRP